MTTPTEIQAKARAQVKAFDEHMSDAPHDDNAPCCFESGFLEGYKAGRASLTPRERTS